MAIGTPTNLDTSASTTNAASYTTASITVNANELVLVWIINSQAAAISPTSLISNGSLGLTWVKADEVNYIPTTGDQGQCSLWRTMGTSTTSGTVTIDFNLVTQSGCGWSMIKLTGADTSGTNGSGAIVQTNRNSSTGANNLSVSLGAFGDAANATLGGFGHRNVSTVYTPGSGFSALSAPANASHGSPNHEISVEYQLGNDTTVDFTWNTTGACGGIAVEIKAAGVNVINVSGSCTPAGAFAKTANKSPAGSATPTGVLTKQTNRSLAGSSSPSAALAKTPARTFGGTSTSTAGLFRQVVLARGGSITPQGVLSQLLSRSLGGQSVPAGGFTQLIVRVWAGTTIPAGLLRRQINRTFTSSVAPAGTLATARLAVLALAGSLSATGALLRTLQRSLGGATIPTGATQRQIERLLGGSATPAGNVAQRPARTVSGTSAPTGVLVRSAIKVLSGSATPGGALAKQLSRTYSGTLGVVGALATSLVGVAQTSLRLRLRTRRANRGFTAARQERRFTSLVEGE